MHISTGSALIVASTDGWNHMDGWGGGWMWMWGTLMMLSWVGIITGAILLVSRDRGSTGGASSSRARDILDERYARGDLTTDDYHERLDQLG